MRLQSSVDMIGGEIVEKELALAETQSVLDQVTQQLKEARREAGLYQSTKKELDAIQTFMTEYQAKANSKVSTIPYHSIPYGLIIVCRYQSFSLTSREPRLRCGTWIRS